MIKKQTVALYIDDDSIRLLVTSGKRVKKWADVPLEPGMVKGTVVLKEKEVAAKIRQLFATRRIKTKKVILGLSGLHSMTRPVSLPSLPKAMLEEAVTRTAGKALPLPLEQLYLTWQTIPGPAGTSQAFVVAVPRKTADTMVKTLRAAGLELSGMAIKPLILTKAVREPTAIVLDAQPTEFDIVIVSGGVPHPVRTVSLPADVPSWQEKLPMIISDLDRTIKFFDSNNQQKPLDAKVPIYVSGELTNALDLQKTLSEALGHPVAALPSPLVTPSTMDLKRYIVNVALSFPGHMSGKVLKSTAAGLNVLPIPYQPKPISLFRILVAPAIVLIMLFITGVFLLMQNVSSDTASLGKELERVEGLIKQRQTQQQELKKSIPEMEKGITSAKRSSSSISLALSSIEKRRDEVNKHLKLALDNLPKDTSLTSIKESGTSVSISGRASKEEQVLSYAQALDSSQAFAETIITSILIKPDGSADFILDLKLKE